MPRHPKPQELKLQERGGENGMQPGPNSSPMNLQGVDLGSFGGGFEHDVAAGLTPLPNDGKDRSAFPQSPPGSPRTTHNRDTSKNLLSTFKSKLSSEPNVIKDTRAVKPEKDDYTRPGTSSMSKVYHLRNNPGSTPELSLVGSQENVSKSSSEDKSALPARPQPTPQHSQDSTISARQKENKEKKGVFRMGRKGSMRRGSSSRPPPMKPNDTSDGKRHSISQDRQPTTAPLNNTDWPGSEARMKGKVREEKRGKSEERSIAAESRENLSSSFPKSEKGKRNAFNKVASGISNFVMQRTGSHNEKNSGKNVPDNEYVIKVINLPLVEQTRKTRISKDLSSCRDKTEYWMPALPWRCIDYLNTNCENEGLYRIPGSGPQVKHWQRRFDENGDIDLLNESVTDPNEIASMLKAWFRELPSELMPNTLQKNLSMELEKVNPNYRNQGQEAPQLLRDALSELPPFNYYLLFAITCHLSLLLTNKDLNKMDLNNLAVCVGPCLNLDRWLFNYLVGDWRHCWQGCFTEKEYLSVEKMIRDGAEPHELPKKRSGDEQSLTNSLWASTINDDAPSDAMSMDERAISSGSSKPDSKYDRSMSHADLHQRNEYAKPMTYLPAGAHMYGNGTNGLGVDQDMQRPATAQGGPPRAMTGTQQQQQQSAPATKSRSNSTAPRIGHSRSRSDLPATPVKTNADFGFPVRPPSRPPSRQSTRRA